MMLVAIGITVAVMWLAAGGKIDAWRDSPMKYALIGMVTFAVVSYLMTGDAFALSSGFDSSETCNGRC
jgi:hypothetical protein